MIKTAIQFFIVVLMGIFFQQCGSPGEKGKIPSVDTVVNSSATKEKIVWTKEKAGEWYARQGWLVGCNFIPSTAINQLEMWQAETFDTVTINRELQWAASLGMNTVRVFLHDLLYQQDSVGFLKRIDIFLQIAARHHIKPLFVLFDSCWDPFPKPGKQRAPRPHVHNSGWVQSPGAEALKDSVQYPRLKEYTQGIVTAFSKDNRILGWDVWNEAGGEDNNTGYDRPGLINKADYVLPLLKKAFEWTREADPSQPVTSGLWMNNWDNAELRLSPIEELILKESDIISFHNYGSPKDFEKIIQALQKYNRPVICTEYMARSAGSTFEGSLPIAKKHNVGAYNWGLVDGKTQTIYPWDSWSKHYAGEPKPWFHEIFRKNGTPYKNAETDLIKKLTGVNL